MHPASLRCASVEYARYFALDALDAKLTSETGH